MAKNGEKNTVFSHFSTQRLKVRMYISTPPILPRFHRHPDQRQKISISSTFHAIENLSELFDSVSFRGFTRSLISFSNSTSLMSLKCWSFSSQVKDAGDALHRGFYLYRRQIEVFILERDFRWWWSRTRSWSGAFLFGCTLLFVYGVSTLI